MKWMMGDDDDNDDDNDDDSDDDDCDHDVVLMMKDKYT